MPGKIVSQDEWLSARNALLEKEKELAKAKEVMSEERRSLPMAKIDKEYTFEGPNNTKLSLGDLFAGQDQLIIYHYMFGPNAEEGCRGCAHMGECLPDVRHMRQMNTNLICVSRAPYAKLEAWKKKNGWTFPWYSSGDSGFSHDLGATNAQKTDSWDEGDVPGFNFFLKQDGEIYRTYSNFSNVPDGWAGTMGLLALTAAGDQTGPNGPAEFKLKFEYDPIE